MYVCGQDDCNAHVIIQFAVKRTGGKWWTRGVVSYPRPILKVKDWGQLSSLQTFWGFMQVLAFCIYVCTLCMYIMYVHYMYIHIPNVCTNTVRIWRCFLEQVIPELGKSNLNFRIVK